MCLMELKLIKANLGKYGDGRAGVRNSSQDCSISIELKCDSEPASTDIYNLPLQRTLWQLNLKEAAMHAQSTHHIYNLPQELLDTLTLRTLFSNSTPSKQILPIVAEDGKQVQDPSGAANIGSRACNICLGVNFSDVDEQRTHFRSDWHRYNVKTRLNGGQAVSEDTFNQLIEGPFV